MTQPVYPVPVHMDKKWYFKPVARPLPNPHRDLAKLVPTTATKEANKHIEDVMSRGKRRQKYQKVSIAVKTKSSEVRCREQRQSRSYEVSRSGS